MKILVTGHCGFIGSNICRRLASREHTIFGIDNLSTGKIENIQGLKIKNNITDINRADYAGQTFDCVMHLAANASIIKSSIDPMMDINTNFIGTVNLLNRVKTKKFLFSSSMCCYGNVMAPFEAGKTLCEPVSTYGVSKYAAERYALNYCYNNRIHINCFRLFNVMGRGQDLNNDYQGVAAIFIRKALKNEDIVIYGNGENTRDFVYIDDVVDLFVNAAENKNFTDVINVGTSIETSILDLAKLILKNIPESRSRIVFKQSRDNEQTNSFCVKSPSFTHTVNLEDGLIRTIEWARHERL